MVYAPSRQIDDKFFEKNSCTVIALKIVCNIPYYIAYDIAEKAGRKPNKGFYPFNLFEYTNKIGYEFRPFPTKCKTIARFAMENPRGRF
ncbi:MAG: hypothetical protein EBU90_29990, partial [Proteobacteria bacterium]|nr:hypothetical protein [Pseudomonadota bacterium]